MKFKQYRGSELKTDRIEKRFCRKEYVPEELQTRIVYNKGIKGVK